MNSKFDELAKGLAQSITRLEAFKRFGVCLAVITSACSLAFPARAQFAQLGPLVELSQPKRAANNSPPTRRVVVFINKGSHTPRS